MSYKNDDLNELFQKAAKDYPLKTDSSDWQNVHIKLRDPSNKAISKNKLLKYALLFFLLVGSTIIFYTYNIPETPQKQQTIHPGVSKQDPVVLNESGNAESLKTATSSTPEIINPTKNISHKRLASFQNQCQANNNSNPDNTEEIIAEQSKTGQILPADNAVNSTKSIHNVQIINKVPENKLTATYSSQADESRNRNSEKAKRQHISLKSSYRLYGSLFGGIEFSTVKFQHIDKPGYRIGAALGYRINKRLNVEIGLQRDQINFYSDGKYIDTSMLKIKPKFSIEDVTASSKLTSVPVTLRYNFLSKGKGHFFATASVNAVVITHYEEYEYSVSKNGVEGNLSKSYSSITSPKYFTGVSASAGYETKLSNLCNIKFEPYYQGAINNFGAGKLPVSSFGLNVGIIKNIK
jgi:hypothetical protein